MQSASRDLKFCSARARVAFVILTHAERYMTFHDYFKSTCTKQYSTKFSGTKDSFSSRFYLRLLHFVIKTVKAMFK